MTHKLDEKALAAAMRAYSGGTNYQDWNVNFQEAVGRAVTTYLAAAPSPAPVAVKALEWKKGRGAGLHFEADTAVGTYAVSGRAWWLDYGGTNYCSPPEAAKAAAQADFERRIRSALVDPAANEAGGQT